jgi:hypothetical protein
MKKNMCAMFVPLVLMLSVLSSHAQLPDPAKGGRNGGPIDILIYRGHCEMDFGRQPPLDPVYLKKMTDRGYRITVLGPVEGCKEGQETNQPLAGEWRPLTLDYLKQFNTVIYLSPSPCFNGGYFDDTYWRGGRHLLTVQQNLKVLQQYVQEGGGLLIVPTLEEICMRTTDSLKRIFEPYGLDTECAVVRDEEHGFVADKIIGLFPVLYSWTEKIGKHPAAAGVRRVWYPAYCTRWDDNYTTIPLYPRDKAWSVLVGTMPQAQAMCLRGSIYYPQAKWYPLQGPGDPALVVARPFGKGRVAVCGIGAFHLFYLTYSPIGQFAEANFSVVDGIAMEFGNTKREPWKPKAGKDTPAAETPVEKVPSDMHILLDNLYRWLGETSVQAGMGGYDAIQGIQAAKVPDMPRSGVCDVWGDKDPLSTGPVRPMKILVGARSAFSGGKGSPQEWAVAAKAAGYDVICFNEAFENLDISKWDSFVAECARASDDKVFLLPGLDFESTLGDRFLVVGHTMKPRTHVLDATGKKLEWTGCLQLAMGDVLSIPARPQFLATKRPMGSLPPDIYYHTPGVAVATYAGAKQVDDGLFAYDWLRNNSSLPIAVAVHEVSSPGELAVAAKTGLQSYVNADTPAHAAFYFRQGHASFGGNPMRYYVSSGPLFDAVTMDNWQSPTWKIGVKAHGGNPITEILAHNQWRLYRRFTPNAREADVSFNGNLGVQQWFLIELRDSAGGKAYASPIRTLPRRAAVIRCSDRQNYFSPLGWGDHAMYTGSRNMTAGASAAVPGVTLADTLCSKLQFFFTSPGCVIHEYKLDSTVGPTGFYGGDGCPIIHDVAIPEYAAKIRYTTMAGAPRQFTVSISLKQDLTPQGAVWPVINRLVVTKAGPVVIPYVYNDAGGKRIQGSIATNGFVDLPIGGVAGNVLALTPLRVDANGLVGFAADGKPAKAGTTYEGSFVTIDPTNVPAIRNSLGFDGEPPFKLACTQGSVDHVGFFLYLKAKNGGVAAALSGAPVPVSPLMPIRLVDANPNWPLGMWDPQGLRTQDFAFLDGVGMGFVDVTKSGEFYFGNTLLATDKNLNLAFAAPWTKDYVKVEVNNPTDKPVTATITAPKAIEAGRIHIEKEVTVPAGGSMYFELGQPPAPLPPGN